MLKYDQAIKYMKKLFFIVSIGCGVLMATVNNVYSVDGSCFGCDTKAAAKKLFILANSVTVTNVTAETSLIQGALNGIGITNIPANFFTAGKKLSIRATGVSSSPLTPGTLTIKIKGGSTVILSTGAKTSIVSSANKQWAMLADITCRTVGSSGVFIGNGGVLREDQATVIPVYWGMVNFPVETITLNTTTAIPFDITAQFSIALGSSITMQTLEVLQYN